MAGPGSVQVPPDSTGKVVDMVSLSVAGVNVVRQVMALGGATDNSSAYAEMAASAPAVSAVGMVVRHAGAINVSAMPTVTVTGGVAISGTAIVAGSVVLSGTATIAGNVNISAMPAVNISTMPTVTVTGAIGISGTAVVAGNVNISTMPTVTVTGGVAISGTATVAGSIAATIVGVSNGVAINISTMPTVTVTGGVAISGTATVAGSVGATIIGVSNGVAINISTMPAITGSIGINSISAGVSIAINAISAGVTIGVNSISATVQCNLAAISAGIALNVQARAPAVMSASRGPKCVTASTSANVTLIASPGAGANIYIKTLGCHNFSGSFLSMRVGTSASVQTIVVAAQSSGGGAVYSFDPPWMLSASEAAVCSVKPNAAYGVFNCQFYVI